MNEAKFLALIKDMTNAELAEMQIFIEYLLKCQEEGHIVTDQEVQEMAAAARARIASQQ